MEELVAEHARFPVPKLWGALIRYVAPIAIASIIVSAVVALL